MKKYFYLLLILLIPFNVKADNSDEFIFSCDKVDKININEQIICRASVKSSFVYNQIKLTIPEISGFQLVDIRSNDSKKWVINNESNNIVIKSEELQTGLQEFAIFLYKATESGEYSLDINDISLHNDLINLNRQLKNTYINLKVISTDNLLKGIYINGQVIDNFNSNTTIYTINSKENKIKISAETNNEYALVSGVGEYEINSNSNMSIFPIKVVSEDGASRIYLIKVINDNFKDNTIDKKLDSIIIKNDKGNNLLIGFNPDVYEYTFNVDMDTNYLEINPSVDNKELDFVNNYGKQKIELVSGSNIVFIKVIDKEGQILNYVLNITKPIANKSDNNYIKSLTIKNYKLAFNKKVKNYTLFIKASDKSLEINPILDGQNSRYTITGNNDLKDGSVIKIIVIAENEESQVYQINIKIQKTSLLTYIIYPLLVGLLAFIIYKFSKNKLVNNKEKNKIIINNDIEEKVVNKEINKEKEVINESKNQSKVSKNNNSNKSKTTKNTSKTKSNTTNKNSNTNKKKISSAKSSSQTKTSNPNK